ncbi:MAG: hypothetical protein COZ85_03030 [Candidatus Moranbacteria bacterium CG_4_8_14_3_um_filter_34_16]|nr:MAG: hypothetical protein COZ85_03030 [Candidatus Moranbacteria bacterium CG_4_8_14_3_um_filter_34_16]
MAGQYFSFLSSIALILEKIGLLARIFLGWFFGFFRKSQKDDKITQLVKKDFVLLIFCRLVAR